MYTPGLVKIFIFTRLEMKIQMYHRCTDKPTANVIPKYPATMVRQGVKTMAYSVDPDEQSHLDLQCLHRYWFCLQG